MRDYSNFPLEHGWEFQVPGRCGSLITAVQAHPHTEVWVMPDGILHIEQAKFMEKSRCCCHDSGMTDSPKIPAKVMQQILNAANHTDIKYKIVEPLRITVSE